MAYTSAARAAPRYATSMRWCELPACAERRLQRGIKRHKKKLKLLGEFICTAGCSTGVVAAQIKTGTSVTSAGDGSESAERLSRPPTVWLIRRQHPPRQDTRPPCAGASCRHGQKGGCREESNGDKKMKLLCTLLYLWQPQDFDLCERRNTPVFSGTTNAAWKAKDEKERCSW